MKLYSTFLIVFLFSTSIFGQTVYKYNYKQGYNFIKKAQKKLQNGNLSKAKKCIANAKNSNYGFCENAWIESYGRINIIEVQILNIQKKYDSALVVLDSLNGCAFGADCSARDSLKVITLFLKFGKEKVIDSFKKVNTVNNSGDPEFEFDSNYWVFLDELNYKFWFKTDYPVYIDGKKVESIKTGNDFFDLAKDQAFYKLIK